MRMGIGLGIGINRSNYAQGIFGAYQSRVVADGGTTEAGGCVDAVGGLLLNASLLLIPSGYKSTKLYSQIPTNGNGDLTWTRASDAFRTNASGLIQRVPWNLVQQSETFANAYWTKTRVSITANSTTAPNGTTTADSLIQDSGQTSRGFVGTPFISISGQLTYSIFAKKNTKDFAILTDNALGLGFENSWFNLNTGTLGTIASGRTATIENVGNGWYRCSITLTSTTTSSSFLYGHADTNNSTTVVDSGGIFIWGAQLVEGTTAQTYLPTTDRLNFPRLSYMYGSCPSVLLEPQRTNLALYSEDLTQTAWAKTNSGTITANSTISPDGTQTADTLNAGANSAQAQQALTGTSGAVYTVSIWVKRITGTGNVILKAVENADTLIAVTSDWQRFTATVTSTSTTIRIGVKLATSGDEVAIWGSQVEAGAFATTYIPTTSASATRVADACSKTGISSLIGQTEGVLFADVTLDVRASSTYFAISGSASTVSKYIGINFSAGIIKYEVVTSGVLQASGTLTNSSTGRFKSAVGYKANDFVFYVNGTQIGTDNSGTVPDCNDLVLYNSTFGQGVPMRYNKVVLFNTRLTNAELASLTTL